MSAEQSGCGVGLFLTLLAGWLVVPWEQARSADELPDAALLEYLGSWDESDEDWVLFSEEEVRTANEDAERASAGDDETAQEPDDER